MESIKTPNFETTIKNIKQYNNLLEIEFVELPDLTEVDLSSINILTSGGIKCTSTPFIDYITIYKTDGNKVILSNDESVYTEPETPIESEPIETYTPTEEEIAIIKAKTKISVLKRQLEETDYKIIKCYEYRLIELEMPYDIAILHTERQVLRDEINILELSFTS